jgi:uncharacterized protein (DUF3084 family)
MPDSATQIPKRIRKWSEYSRDDLIDKVKILQENEKEKLKQRMSLRFELDACKTEIQHLQYALQQVTTQRDKSAMELQVLRTCATNTCETTSHNSSPLWKEMFGINRRPQDMHTECINCHEIIKHNKKRKVLLKHAKTCQGVYTLV